MWKELRRLVISALGAAIAACVITFFQYLGAHIPEIMAFAGMWGTAHLSLYCTDCHA